MIILDDYLSGELLEKIRDDSLWIDNVPSRWLDYNSKPVNTYTELANRIWYTTIRYNKPFVGYEYWTQVVSNRDLGWHQDKDEHYYNTTGSIKTPSMGSIYYAHEESVTGGFLEIKRGDEVERIQPVPNRLIIFDSSAFHRVTHTSTGVRKSLLVNIWEEKPMVENFM